MLPSEKKRVMWEISIFNMKVLLTPCLASQSHPTYFKDIPKDSLTLYYPSNHQSRTENGTLQPAISVYLG